jgi:peptide/nickel transport system substrate-binding protein
LLEVLSGHLPSWLGWCAVPDGAVAASAGESRHAIAMHGEPAYPAGFIHFRYANPDAPKGGRLTQAFVGTFDSLNPFIVRGNAFQQMRGFVIESLLARGYDEPFTLYGLLAQRVSTDEARTHVVFELDSKAQFADGRPVLPEDVLFSWRLLRDKGRPNHRSYYSKVTRAEKVGEYSVRFDFGGEPDRELPLILGLMPVLPRHAIDEATFEETTLSPMLGSGPYQVAEVRPGESVLLRRDPNYWGRDLAVNRGHYNFDDLRFEFFRDGNTWFEAFKRGLYDVRFETDPGRWAAQYDFPAAQERGLVREGIVSGQPKPFQAFVFNTRRELFADPRVREALIELFDFEWANASLFYGAYRRTVSFFEGSELSARGRPAGSREQALLASVQGFRASGHYGGNLSAAGFGRLGTRSGAIEAGAGIVDVGWLQAAWRDAVGTGRFPDVVRTHGRNQGRRTPCARLCEHASARRNHGKNSVCRRRAIRASATRLRFRRHALYVATILIAGQRAGFLFRFGCG